MSRYEELMGLAIKCSDGLDLTRQDCGRFSYLFVSELKNYLGCDHQGLRCYEVNTDFRVIGDPTPLPKLCLCFDAFWYFSLEIMFPDIYGMSILVGIGRCGDVHTVKVAGEKDTKSFAANNGQDRNHVYEFIYSTAKEELSRPWDQPRRRLGFVPPVKA